MRNRKQKINHASFRVALLLSLIALFAVLSGYLQPPQSDEGAGAHIFQLAIVLLLPAVLVCLATVDWTQPLRNLRALLYPALALILAFGALSSLEHYRDPNYRTHNTSILMADNLA
jgi:hypothetical protein